MSIAVIAGLGNPGSKYRNTRHNLGFEVVDALSRRYRCKWKLDKRIEAETTEVVLRGTKVLLVKPQTFVNASGRSLGALLRYRKTETARLAVVYDDINLDPGRVKVSLTGSAGGHNGVADLLETIGDGFCRFRVGIGGKPHREMDLADYVLGRHEKAVETLLAERMPRFLDMLEMLVEVGPVDAMNTLNQRTDTLDEQHENPQL